MKYLVRLLPLVLLCVSLLFSSPVHAQDDRWYQYNRIETEIRINRNTSFDVSETQTYLFHGEYHQGYREIPFRKIDAITNVRVIDDLSGNPLTFSRRRLEKTNPSSWGKYTTFTQSGSQVIEWYYDANDEKRAWRLEYRVEGGLEFLRDSDRLYWNLFTDYQVPVVRASVTVIPPDGAVFDPDTLRAYRTTPIKQITRATNTDGSVMFESRDFNPQEAFTIDVQWPKGFIDRRAYWRTFLRLHYGYVGAALVMLISILVGFVYWMIHEKVPQSRLTTVPQYKPPKNLRPAVAEIVVKETLTPKGMAATIVDLAVRGYLTIEESPTSWFSGATLFGVLFFLIVVGGLSVSFAGIVSHGASLSVVLKNGLIGAGVFVYLLLYISGGGKFTGMKNYKVTQVKDFDPHATSAYERNYVSALMRGSVFFTTEDLKRSRDRGLYQAIQGIKDDIYSHTQVETRAFAVDPLEEKKKWLVWGILIFGVFFLIGYTSGLRSQLWILIESMIVGGIGLFTFLRFEARLNQEGMKLKDEWLGFKMFLETAEKGEHARATPDMFPRYLPYAMIFGVEKKWAKAFEGANIPTQTWYVGGGVHGGGGSSFSSGSGGFSGFSASFSSSFASAFASSAGGGGGGGGGGGAGGGGGGGGGGAS